MRPVLVLAIIILFIISAYYDLNNGTIPDNHYESNNTTENTEEKKDEHPENTSGQDYLEVIVEPGHTVYGIVRALHDTELTIPPYIVTEDFELLNPGTEAHRIQTGQAYRFPVYNSSESDNQS
ncbi:hypothetical protein MM300_16000 [Evansella sp. LMS18]|uniref:hypothetical protein n=1 Tax=Evansella sp. LMS18 TaxID=2924033 RepID=UPI0020D02CDB|nr:hypothetical protein [Evansella sp. LMS18]UTR09390.1 hypothetical protein MM300_16000 [Evansella sp. LMS18]